MKIWMILVELLIGRVRKFKKSWNKKTRVWISWYIIKNFGHINIRECLNWKMSHETLKRYYKLGIVCNNMDHMSKYFSSVQAYKQY